MSKEFDPDFIVDFETFSDIDSIVLEFRTEFDTLITRSQGSMFQTEDNYLMFNTDYAYKYGSKTIPSYSLSVNGKQAVRNDTAEDRQKEFARKVVKFLEEHGCKVAFSAFFSIEE